MIKLKSLLLENVSPTKIVVYHGTNIKFKKFNLKKSAQGLIWFTSKKENIINGEVGAAGKGIIITAEVTFNKPAGWKEYSSLGLWELEREGYDGAILPNDRGFDCFVMSPKQIKMLKAERIENKPEELVKNKLVLPNKITENKSLNATLIWLDKNGAVYDTNDTQHGLYVADNRELFGVSNSLVQKVFKNANTDERFDFDEASAAMCEQAFMKGWLRVVKVPWNNKIFVEGNEPTKAQKQVLEDWFFEDKSKDIIWQRWVSSKFGPAKPITLFFSET